MPEHCVVCCIREVLENVVSEHSASLQVENRWEDGAHPIYQITYQDHCLAFYHPGIGAALSAALLEEGNAFACSKFIACGALEKDIAPDHLIVASEALRDEGVSYHYPPPGRTVNAHPLTVTSLDRTLHRYSIPHRVGKT